MSLKKKKEEEFSVADSIINGTWDDGSLNVSTPQTQSVANTVNTLDTVSNNIKKSKTTMSFDDDKKEETSSVADNIIKGVNPLDKAVFVGKSAGAGLVSGLTGVVDAPLQNIQEGAQKGKKKGKLENYLQGLARTLDIYGLSTMPETAKEVQQIVQDKNKKGWEKALNIGGAILNNNPLVNNLEAAGQQLNIVDKNADKNIKKARKVIETPSNKLNENVAKDSEKMGKGWQIAGEVSQTIGNMIPSMALSAVTKNPDIGLAAMGVSAKGQATKEAEERGADLSTANEIGLGKGLVEVGTEKLTGGLKFFGKGTADDLVEKGINKAIKNKAGNFIAKQAVGMAGEVGEETISDLVGTAIDKATVDPDASYSFDDWKKTALMTMLSTGALNTISGGYGRKAYQLNAEELNDIAQSKKVQDTVNERVEQFKTPDMTPEQVEQLREQTTAVVLGEIQQNVDDILDSSIAQLQEQPQIPTQTPINTLSSNIQEQNNQILGQQQTPQITPLNQVNQELQETRQNDIANQVQAMNLEQEPQFTQKQGNYVYEKSDNSKIDNLRKDAATYLKEGEQTTNFVNTLEKLVKDKDIEIRFDTKLGNNVNGTYKDGVITINPNSNRAGEFVAIHELTHAIGTKPMIDMIQTYRKSNAEFNNAVERLLSTYKTTEINEEALGDIAGQLFGNQEYINNLSMENPSLFKKIYNEIKYLWHQFTGYKNQDQFIEDLRNKWESAYRNQKVQQKAKNSNIEMSNQTDSNGNVLSNEQVDYFKDSKVRDENGNLIPVYHGTNYDFTIFKNPSRKFNEYASGKMFENTSISMFTDSQEVAQTYIDNEENQNKKPMKEYLNITNPYIIDAKYQNNKFFYDENGNPTNVNELVKKIYDSGKYDGVIIKNIADLGNYEDYDVTDGRQYATDYIVFNSNQIKNVDNLNPTEDPDIRYSKDNQTWREYLEKEFPSQGTRTNLQDINERNKPKKVEDTTKQEKPQETPEKEVKQEVKKSYLTSAEQNELDGLRDLDNSGLLEENDSDYKRLQELEKKSQGITKKFPELKTKNTFDDIKSIYGKYKNSEISRENNKVLNEAKNFIEANKQGRRTIEEWKQIAEYIGSNADIKNSQDLQKLAMETWFNQKPNNPQNLNRQGKKYVKFGVDDWVNAVYKGAGVGTEAKLSQEERNTINESKQDEVAVLRTPTEIQPKEVKTPEQKQEYFEESGTPKKVAKILSETPRETETSTLREKYQTLKRAVVDKGEAIYRIAKQTKNRRLYAMYDRIGLATGEGNSDIGISQTNLDGESYKNFTDSKGNKTSMSLNDIWKDVEDSNIPENVMNEYLANYLNVDRYKANQLSIEEIEELKELNKYKNLSKTQKERVEELNTLAETRNVFGKDITREDSLNKIKEIEEKYPQIKRPAENIWQYGKNQLQKMVDAGLVSKESQEYYNENTPHYVRLQRSTESKKGSVFDSRGHLQVNNQIKKAKGGTKDIIPFKDSMAQYTLDTTSSIRKNLFGQELSNTLKNGLETDGDIDIDNIDNNILNENEDGSYTFKIFKDGKPEILTIDKGIYEALQPNKHYELEKLFKPFKAISNFKRTVLTDKNPLFLATNFFKDFFDAPLNTKHSTVDFIKNYSVAINQIIKNGEYYQKYQALGGNQNTYFDKEGFSKPGKLSKLVAPIEKANEFIEMLPRMSEFITSLKKGESLDEAMYNAAEITTNFKRGGTATKIINRNGATFLNASVQGFDKQIRNFTEIENPKQAARLLTKALVLGVAPALLNAVMYDDDDEYEDLPDYVKDSYYLFKTGKDNKWIRIPKGRAISVIQAAARRTYNYSKGDKDAYKGLAGHFENQLAPNNPLESNVLSPLVDVKNNKAWSGNKIVSDSIANASHPEEEYDAKTDELSKWLGKKLGKSPKKINYIIDQNTGAIGDLLLPFLTKQAEGEDDSLAGRLLKNPVKDKFTTDAVLNSKQVNQFYDAFNKAEDDKKWSKATDEDKLKYKYLYSTMLDLAEKNKQIKEIESSDKSDKEKYRETKAIKQEMNDMSKKAVKESENIKINDYYAQIDDKVYKKEYDKSTGEYKYTKVQQKQLDKIKDKGVPLSDYFREAYEKQKKRATK